MDSSKCSGAGGRKDLKNKETSHVKDNTWLLQTLNGNRMKGELMLPK